MLGTLLTAALALAAMPAFQLESAGGAAPLRSSALAGKPYVLQFFASWCTSCASVKDGVAAALAASPVRYLPVSLDEDVASAARGFAGKDAWFDADRALATALGDVAVPTVVVVDAAGRIRARIAGHFGAAQRGELESALRLSPLGTEGAVP